MMKAILTGHNRGLGAAITQELLSRKISVLGLSRHANPALASQFPVMLEQVQLDLADSTAVVRWLAGAAVQRFVADCNTVLLINNAATVQPVGSIVKQDPVAIAHAVGLNLTTPMILSSAVAAAASKAADIRILHISSGAARSAYAGWSVYCATKAALDQHARAAALEPASRVRICSLAPGIIDTGMQAEIRATSLEDFPQREKFDGLKRHGQLANPAICARQVVDFLLSRQFGQLPVADLRELTV